MRAPAATPRRWAGTAPIIAAVLGLMKAPMPMPTIASVVALTQYAVCTSSSVISASPAAASALPAAASPREP